MTGKTSFVLLCLLAGALLGSAPAAAGDVLKSGDVFRDCPRCPEMVVVPAGSFVMGTKGAEKAKGDKRYEGPALRVTLAHAFAIGRYEVTFDQWKACHADGGCGHDPDDHGWGRGRRPVVNVTFADIGEYLAWLTRITGHTYRLPSEAEWEYAARAGTKTDYWWGDAVGRGNANCRECGSQWSGSKSAPVGSFPANPFGLFDTSGNVWDWVADCWNPTLLGAPADGAVRTDGHCGGRVTRGGSWYYFPRLSRSAFRYKNNVLIKSYNIGFRVVRPLP